MPWILNWVEIRALIGLFVLQCLFHLVFKICALLKDDLPPHVKLFKPTVFICSASLYSIFWHIHTSFCNYRGIFLLIADLQHDAATVSQLLLHLIWYSLSAFMRSLQFLHQHLSQNVSQNIIYNYKANSVYRQLYCVLWKQKLNK